jgi:transcription elongation factor GreA
MEYISPEGLEKLKKELEERKTKKRHEIAQHLEEAKSLGDLSENTEYSAAKDEQMYNENRIMELEEIIKEASLIKVSKGKSKIVQMGSWFSVKMMDPANSAVREFMIVGSQEADPSEGKISYESPLGKAFIGRKVNDIIEAETPRGKTKYKIMNIK